MYLARAQPDPRIPAPLSLQQQGVDGTAQHIGRPMHSRSAAESLRKFPSTVIGCHECPAIPAQVAGIANDKAAIKRGQAEFLRAQLTEGRYNPKALSLYNEHPCACSEGFECTHMFHVF